MLGCEVSNLNCVVKASISSLILLDADCLRDSLPLLQKESGWECKISEIS